MAALALLGCAACGRDVLVGLNFDDDDGGVRPATTDGGGTPVPGTGDGGAELAGLLAVARVASGHVAGGHVGCAAPDAGGCEGWLATVPDLVEQGRFVGEGLDAVWALAPLAGGDLVVGGERTASGVGFAWLARRSATGALPWETSLSSDPARRSSVRAVAVAPDGAIVAGGHETLGDGREHGWVARISADGATTSRFSLSATIHDGATIDAITAIPQNQAHAAGSSLSGGVRVATAFQFSPTGEFWGSQVGLGLPLEPGRVTTALGDRSLEVTFCAQVGDGAAVSRMSSDLAPILSRRLLEPGAPIAAGGCPVTDDGAIVVVGSIERDGATRPWAAKVDRVSLDVRWQRVVADAEGRLVAVAPGPDGAAVAVGTSGGRAYVLSIEP